MFDPGLPEVGFADVKLRLGPFPVGRHDGHFTRGDGNNDVVHAVGVMAGGAARRQPPFGDADLRGVNLNVRFGAEHCHSPSALQGTNTRNTNTANTTTWTSPNRMLVRPVPKVSMLRTKVSISNTMLCGSSPSTS